MRAKIIRPLRAKDLPDLLRIGRAEAVTNASGVYVHANTCAKLIVRQKKLTLLVAVRSETKGAPDPKIVSG